MAKQIKQAKFIQNKSKIHNVTRLDDFQFEVKSGASGKSYTVTLAPDGQGGTCTCPWSKYRPATDQRSGCSHVVSAIEFKLRQEQERYPSVWTDRDDADRQKKHQVSIGDGVILTTRAVGS